MGSIDSKTVEDADVIIIGAGISGCGAAWYLHKKGCSSLILEASDRVGGKTYTIPNQNSQGGCIDLGASWVNDTTQSYINALIEELGLERVEQDITGLAITQRPDGSFFAHDYHDSVVGTPSIFSLPLLTCADKDLDTEEQRRRQRSFLFEISPDCRVD